MARQGWQSVELVEVVDAGGAVVDVVTRAEMRAANLRHRATYIVVRSTGGDVLVHRRAGWKDVWPGYWDVAFGGVVGAGEEWLDAARRELAEEAGIDDVPPGAFTELGPLVFESDQVRVVGRVYEVCHDGPFTFPDREVEQVAWIPVAELPPWLTDRDVCPDTLAGVVPLVH